MSFDTPPLTRYFLCMTQVYRLSSPFMAAILTGTLGNAILACLAEPQFQFVSMALMTILATVTFCASVGLRHSRTEIDDIHSGGPGYLRASGANLVITRLASSYQTVLQASALIVARSLAGLAQQIILTATSPHAESTHTLPTHLPAAGVNLTPRLIPVPQLGSTA